MKFDPTLAFYLEHQKLIDEWHDLRKQVPELAHAYYASLEEPFRAVAMDLPGCDELHVSLDSGHPKLFLYAAKWRDGDESPRVAIGLEWQRDGVDFTNAYMGVWVNRNTESGPELGALLRKKVKSEVLGQGYSQTAWWPAYRYEPAPTGYWSDITPFTNHLLDRLRENWTRFHEQLDQTLVQFDASSST